MLQLRTLVNLTTWILLKSKLTFWIEQPGDTVLFLGHVEDGFETFSGTLSAYSAPIDEIGPVPVDDRTERQPVPPGFGEILHGDARILVSGTFRPS